MRYVDWASRIRVPLGFALAIVYFLLARPTLRSVGIGGAMAAVGLFIRGWAAGCLQKNERLAIAGPYAYSRNPLYFGSFVIATGFSIASRSVLIFALSAALFALIYYPVMKREAKNLTVRFGEAYRRYAEETPLFWPRLSVRNRSLRVFQWSRYWHNSEYNAALGFAAAVIVLLVILKWRG